MPIRYRKWICQLGNWICRPQCNEEDLESDIGLRIINIQVALWIYEIEWAHPRSEARKEKRLSDWILGHVTKIRDWKECEKEQLVQEYKNQMSEVSCYPSKEHILMRREWLNLSNAERDIRETKHWTLNSAMGSSLVTLITAHLMQLWKWMSDRKAIRK